jgi:phosphatidylglycerophosphate synthase
VSAPFTLDDVHARTYKSRDSWWTVLLVDPVASRLVVPIANRTSVTPNQLTAVGFGLGVVSAALFWLDEPWALLMAAVTFHLSFLLDCMDGKIARLKGTGTILGGWTDYILDRLRVLLCSIGLFGGQYVVTHDVMWVWLAFAVVFADMLRYLDALQVLDVYLSMQAGIEEAGRATGTNVSSYLARLSRDGAPKGPEADELSAGRSGADDPKATIARRFGWFTLVQRTLRRHRIRPHLFGGIELQMFVFIVGPVAAAPLGSSALVAMTIASLVLLAVFEIAIVYMAVLTARDYATVVERIRSGSTPASP